MVSNLEGFFWASQHQGMLLSWLVFMIFVAKRSPRSKPEPRKSWFIEPLRSVRVTVWIAGLRKHRQSLAFSGGLF